jgi:hypothetical protein
MEKRAAALGVAGKIRYACPWQCQTTVLDNGASKYGSQVSGYHGGTCVC